MTGLPGTLGAIARVAGEKAALRLAQELGGTSIKLSADPGGKLATIIGQEAADAIVKEWAAGYTLLIPMAHLRGAGARRAELARLIEEKRPVRDVALAGEVHERTVKRMRAKLRSQDDLPLFRK